MIELEVETVTLEDGINYLIIGDIRDNENEYLYLSNENKNDDFCIRKSKIQDGKKVIIPLDSEDEFKRALELYKISNS